MPDGRIMPRSVPDGRGKNRKKRKLMAKIRHKFPLFYYGGKVALRFLHPINYLTFYGNSDMIAAGGWNKMENEKRKKKKKIAVTIFLLVAATACYSMMSSGSEKDLEIRNAASASEEETETTGESTDTEEGNENVQEESGGREDSEETIPQIYVDVGGAVNTPRVVCIPEGARVFEAIEAAGGVSADAETKYINMAAECADGEKIYVPNQEEMAAAQNGEDTEGLFASEMEEQTGGNAQEEDGTVNINTATSDELQTLDGIGPAMASRIIEYRQTNGNFTSVDDLGNVSGIGEKTLEKLRPHVSV